MKMKRFFKAVLFNTGVWIGTVLLLFLLFCVCLALLTRESPRSLQSNSLLVLDLNLDLRDSPAQSDLSGILMEALTGGSQSNGLYEWIRLLEKAATDEKIVGLVLKGSFSTENYASGYPVVLELGKALQHFRKKGKKVYAWLETPQIRDYLLASYADEIHISPSGLLSWNGLGVQGVFLTEFLERNGVRVNVFQAGKYKGATDMFQRREFSQEQREQWQRILDGQWRVITEKVAINRKVSMEGLNRLSRQVGILDSQEAKSAGLVDHVSYFDEFLERLKVGGSGEIHQITREDYIELRMKSKPVGKPHNAHKIAVVYIEGDIVAGESIYPMAGGETYAREIRRLREDPSVKAVVIRVNSPGGVAFAGEQIAREVALTRSVKTVIASLGTYATSAGYMVAAPSQLIYADPTTLTGSIGAFMLFPDFEQTAQDYGITSDRITTGPFGGALSFLKTPSTQERAIFERLLHGLYGDFLNIVMNGRGLSLEEVSTLAEGQLWSGEEATLNKLADRLGGLDDAIQYARFMCGDVQSKLVIQEFPQRRSSAELLDELFAGQPMVDPLSAQHIAFKSSQWLPSGVRNTSLSLMRFFNGHRNQNIYSRLPFWLEE